MARTTSLGSLARGRYRIERRLGAGGMASVYLARDEELGRPVAIKVLADNLAGDATFRARFVREARLAAGLAHPNVVTVFDADEEDGTPFIVMEHVEGETLAELVRRRGSLPPREAVELTLQAAAGLAHAHAAGLVHRDVKPQNLLLRRDGTVKVADFGIARAAESSHLTELGTVLGTAAYLAPEQAAGQVVTAAADVYSLGAVLYQLLTGQPPYLFESLAELGRLHTEGAIAPVRMLAPEASPELEAVVMRALARLPEYRPPTAAELVGELAATAPEMPTEPLPPARHRSRGRPSRLAALAAAAVVVAAGIVLAASGREDDPPPPIQVEPIQPGATPEQGARNLADWLRRHAEQQR
jgi:serine/threonine-protein kinase